MTSIEGGAGDDTIIAAGEVVKIDGEDGNDQIVGTPTVAVIDGGEGDDAIYGETAPPGFVIPAGAGVTTATASNDIDGDDGPNVIHGGDGDQTIHGHGGNDTIFGERGNDKVFGDEDNDRLYGGMGDDLVSGGDGDDLAAGGNGSDNAIGNYGDDLIRGDTIGDVRHTNDPNIDYPDGLNGGPDIDTLSFATAVTPGFTDIAAGDNPSQDYPNFPSEGGERGVYVDLGHLDPITQDADPIATNGVNKDGGGTDIIGDDFERVIGSAFSDVIIGDGGSNVFDGGGGADVLLGMGGNDTLYGGADGDHLEGGDGTNDATYGGSSASSGASNYCIGYENNQQSNCSRSTRGVALRPTDRVSVGFVQTGWSGEGPFYSQAYVAGSDSLADTITTTYNSTTKTLKFTSSGPPFDVSQTEGCTGQTVATCVLPANRPLDAVLYSGGGGNDDLRAYGGTLPDDTSAFLLGGKGNDRELHGSDNTEDVLVDGPADDGGSDILKGWARSDVLYQGSGKDWLYGGEAGDTLLSSQVCEANTLDGGPDNDNAAWANMPLPNRSVTPGVYAHIGTNVLKAGEYGNGSSPTCAGGTTMLDILNGINHLEGSGGKDRLVGDNNGNTLIGRAGTDSFYGGLGDDKVHTNSDDYDGVIDCGADADELVRDRIRADQRDTNLQGCEPSGISEDDPQYDFSVDKNVIGGTRDLLAFYRLGERSGATAYASDQLYDPSMNGGQGGYPLTGTYNGGVTLGVSSPIPDTEDTAVRLDGTNDWIDLGNRFDPFAYASSGYSFELWAKFNGAPAAVGQYIFSKFPDDSSKGLFLYRIATGQLVFGTKRSSGVITQLVTTTPVSQGAWHHLVGTLSGSTLTLYVDGTPQSQNPGQSVFPDMANNASIRVGFGPVSPGWLPADVDSVAIFGRALSVCEVGQHYSIRTAGAAVPTCP